MSSRTRSLLTPSSVLAVVIRPQLWMTAVKQIGRLAPRGWWRRAPFLPVPSPEYTQFRLVTQYGGGHGEQSTHVRPLDVVDYLEWCRQWNKSQ